MGDRELLQMAAKAAGLPVWEWDYEELRKYGQMVTRSMLKTPLDDDGAALRLAAVLRLEIKPGKHKGDGCTVETQRPGIAGCTAFYDDKAKQMRQAIVRAAAEIGKAMP